MSKYLRLYDSISAATADENIFSPNTSLIENDDVEIRLHFDTNNDDDKLQIVLSGSGDVVIQKKEISSGYLTFTCISAGG